MRQCLAVRRSVRVRGARGFTLIELLVVILIILLVSAVALPVVLPAMAHREVSEAARMLQAALVGARIRRCGRMLRAAFACFPTRRSRWCTWRTARSTRRSRWRRTGSSRSKRRRSIPKGCWRLRSLLPRSTSPIQQAMAGDSTRSPTTASLRGPNVLMVKEIAVESTGLLNAPTSWFWNIRVGDKLQINGAGLWYTVVGPMVVTPQQGNTELFVNMGPAGHRHSAVLRVSGTAANPVTVQPEFLFLVNGVDDNKNGWIDEGYDGVDNNYNAEVANGGPYIHGRPLRVGARGLALHGFDHGAKQSAVHDSATSGSGGEFARGVAADQCGGRPDDLGRMRSRSGRSFRRG